MREGTSGERTPAGALRAGLARAGRRPLRPLVLLGLVAGGAWLFAELAGEVVEGETHAFDERVLLALRTPGDPADPLGPGWVEEMGRDVTALGGVAVVTLTSLAACGYLALRRKLRTLVLVATTVGGGQLLSLVLKAAIDRPRPELVPHGSIVYTSSFPSGHSMMAAVTYLSLGVLLARVQPRRALRAYLLGLALLVTLLVGISRVYMGVHYPTDVLAGWTVGAVWAVLCSLGASWLQRRGRVEPEAPPPAPGEPG